MKLNTLALVAGPPVTVVVAIAIFNPDALTWPMVLVIALVVGIFGAVLQRTLED